MNCDEVRNFMHDYLDNELSAEQSKDFESSLTKCPTEFNYFEKLNKHLIKVRSISLNFEPAKEILAKITENLMSSKTHKEVVKPVIENKKIIPQKKKFTNEKIILERDIRKAVRRKKILISLSILLIISIVAFYFYNNFLTMDKPWLLEVIKGNIKINNEKPKANQVSEGDLIWVNVNSQARLLIPGKASINLNEINSLKIISTKKQNRIELINPNLRFLSLSTTSNFEFNFKDFVITEKYAGFNFSILSGDSASIDVFQGFITINDNRQKINVVKNYQVNLNNNFVSIPVRKSANPDFSRLANTLSSNPNNSDALITILIAAEKADVFTLFEIFKSANPTNREMILEKIKNSYPLPKSISNTEVLLLYPEALGKYWNSILENYSK